jgi:hypothetical protein
MTQDDPLAFPIFPLTIKTDVVYHTEYDVVSQVGVGLKC